MKDKVLKNSEITVLIVIYKETYELVSQTLKQLNSYPIIIIDNGNDIDLKDKIENSFKINKYILNKTNSGFSAGYNQAIKLCETKFCLILGPDCIIENNSIIKLLEAYIKYDNCFMVAPTSYGANGVLTYVGGPLPEKGSKDKILKLEGDVCVESVLGACMLVKISDLKNIKMFDENLFLYFSDDDLCRKIKKINRSIIQVYDAKSIQTHGILKISNKFLRIFIREYNLIYDGLYYYHKVNNEYFYLKNKKKINSYLIKFFLRLLLLRIGDSIYLLSKICAYYSFVYRFKWRGGRAV